MKAGSGSFDAVGGRPRRRRGVALAAVLLAVRLLAPAVGGAHVAAAPGQPLANAWVADLLTPGDYASLGLAQAEGGFHLEDIAGDYLVLEFFNKHCVPCQRQVRRVEAFYTGLQAEGLHGRVRLLGLAAGNKAEYLPRFAERRGLTFPIAADPDFRIWRALGTPGRTPFTVFLRREGTRWVLVDAHFGVREEGWLLQETLLHLRDPAFRGEQEGLREAPEGSVPPASPELDAAARRLFQRLLGEGVDAARVALADGSWVHQAVRGGQRLDLFARAADRESLCEVCHGLLFLLGFDRSGTVRGYETLRASKWGNEPWSTADSAFLEGRLRGRPARELLFDETVDAVARATISSALVFDEARQLELLLPLLP